MNRERVRLSWRLLLAGIAVLFAVAIAALFARQRPTGTTAIAYAGSVIGASAAAVAFGTLALDPSRADDDRGRLADTGGSLSMLAGTAPLSVVEIDEPWRSLFLVLYGILLAAAVGMVGLSLGRVRAGLGFE